MAGTIFLILIMAAVTAMFGILYALFIHENEFSGPTVSVYMFTTVIVFCLSVFFLVSGQDAIAPNRVLNATVVSKNENYIQCSINSECRVTSQCNCTTVCVPIIISNGNGGTITTVNCTPQCDRCPIYPWEMDHVAKVSIGNEVREVRLTRYDAQGSQAPEAWSKVREGQPLGLSRNEIVTPAREMSWGTAGWAALICAIYTVGYWSLIRLIYRRSEPRYHRYY